MYDNYNDDYLMHYGVKGMKWGVRRNRDAFSVRAAGHRLAAKAYGVNENFYSKNNRNKTMASMNKAAKNEALKKAEQAQAAANQRRAERQASRPERLQKVADVSKASAKKIGEVTKDHTGVDNRVDKKAFRERRRSVGKSRTMGAKLATNILAGPFANRTYNSVIASGGSKAGAIGVTAAASLLGPIGHLGVSALYTNNASEISYRD